MDLGSGTKAKIKLFQNISVMLHIKQQHGSKYFAHRHTFDLGGGVKRSNHFFLKVVMLHVKLKGIEHRAP